MAEPRWQRIKALFAAALGLPAAERAAFLERECGNDATTRREVESLLKAHVGGTDDSPAGRPSEGPGTWIGPYRVLEEIGEGGFGTVFLAEQERPVRRRVALKVIKAGMDTRQVVARFEQERQALALMDHPGIARVFDGGTTASGRPYFVMELVRGDPITAYCDRERLSMRERLELFAQVCRAVQHAHQKGVIHRDIKPSNVLVTIVDGRPVPKVIDFGVAKATQGRLTDRTLFTEHRQMIGTPLYMSPEQAQLSGVDVDTRSDVYSLGVLLYELLTGVPPFDQAELLQAGIAEMHRMIRELEPKKPSTRIATLGPATTAVAAQRKVEPGKLGTLLRGDLDWIVMRCLEKERARRYDTASDLAQDLERHLAGDPVEAAPPSAAYRMRKLVRRQKGAFVAAAVVTLVGLAGVSATLWQSRARVVDARKSAERQRDLAAEAVGALRDKEYEAYVANLLAANLALQTQDGITMRAALDRCPEDLRGWEWRHLDAESKGAMAVASDRRMPFLSEQWEWGGLDRCWDGETADLWDPNRQSIIPSAPGVQGSWVLCASRIPGGARIAAYDWDDDKTLLVKTLDMVQGTAIPGEVIVPGEQHRMTIVTNDYATVPIAGAFSADGRWLLTCYHDAEIWDTETGTCTWNGGRSWQFKLAGFSRNGKRLVVSKEGRDPIVIDPSDGRLVCKLTGHEGVVESCRFSPDDSRIVTVSRDGRARVWTAESGSLLAELGAAEGPVVDACFLGDGAHLVGGISDGTIRVWDIEASDPSTEVRTRERTDADNDLYVASSADGAWIATTSDRFGVQVWNATSRDLAVSLVTPLPRIQHPVFSPDGEFLATSTWDDSKIIWHSSSWGPSARERKQRWASAYLIPDYRDRSSGEPHGNFFTDSMCIVAGDVVFDALTGQDLDYLWDKQSLVGMVQRPELAGNVLARSAEGGSALVHQIGRNDDSLVIWDAQEPTGRRPLLGRMETDVQASIGGRRVSTLSKGGIIRLWDLGTGRLEKVVGCESDTAAAHLSPDGQRLLIIGPSLRIVDATSGEQTVVLEQGSPFPSRTGPFVDSFTRLGSDAARDSSLWGWSPDGARIFGMIANDTPMLWDAESGGAIAALSGHTDEVLSFCFHPGERRVATSSRDRTVRIWDTDRGRELACLVGHSGGVFGVAFSPDGTRLVSSSWDGTFRVWDTMSGAERAAAVTDMREAVERMRARMSTLDLASGGSPWERLSADESLSPVERRACAAVLCERDRVRQETYARTVAKLLSPSISTEEAELALGLVRKATDRHEGDIRALCESRALALYRLGRYSEALEVLESLCKGGCSFVRANAILAMTYCRLGMVEEARTAFEAFLNRSDVLDEWNNGRGMLPEVEAVFAECGGSGR